MNKKAFTLLELAIVLLIIGILSAGAMRMMSGAFTSSKYTRTKNSITLAVKEIADYTVRARRLPASIQGIISQERDAFNTNLEYFADTTATTTASICNMTSTPLTINVCSTADCSGETITENNVAFILASHGEDQAPQYTISGTTYTFYKDGVNVDEEESDDVVGWMTLNTLKAMAGCEGSLSIEQNKLPDAIAMNTYSYTLTPKGGVAPYDWCIETDNHPTLLGAFYFGSSANLNAKSVNSRGACSSASNYVNDIGEVILNTNGAALDTNKLGDDNSGSSLITVRLRDSEGTEFVKQYDLRLLRQFEVAMDAPESTTTPGEGFSDFESSLGETINSNGDPNSASVIIKEGEIQIVQNNKKDSVSVFTSCTPASCPPFANKGKFAAYFVYSYSNQASWREVFGLTFAVIKSYKPGTSATAANTTLGLTGDSGPGMGYGDNGWIDGINGGNSFGVEFDLSQESFQMDPDDDHLAIVSRADVRTNWNTPMYSYSADNRPIYNPLQVYTSHAQNVHNTTINNNPDQYWSHNDAKGTSKQTGKGVYYDSTSAVIPNNYNVATPVKYGIRVEALSGCNYKCSVCDKQTGKNNYIFINVWRASESAMAANSTLASNMQTVVSKHHTYDYINAPAATRAYPANLGTPLMTDCVPDDTTTNRTLDTIRYGFTSGKWSYSYDNYIKFIITDFKASVSQY